MHAAPLRPSQCESGQSPEALRCLPHRKLTPKVPDFFAWRNPTEGFLLSETVLEPEDDRFHSSEFPEYIELEPQPPLKRTPFPDNQSRLSFGPENVHITAPFLHPPPMSNREYA